jgi:hypothetical protein
MLLLISDGVHPHFILFFKKKFRRRDLIGPSPIFWEHEGSPQHRSLNMFPSLKIEACFAILHFVLQPRPCPPSLSSTLTSLFCGVLYCKIIIIMITAKSKWPKRIYLGTLLLKEHRYEGKYVVNRLLLGYSQCIQNPPCRVTVNQHPPTHHQLDAPYYSVVDEPQLS